MLVDLRDAVEKEIARGATEDQTAATIKLPQSNRCKDTNPIERSRCAARTEK
jgi:hypothetical protein